ncbi:MAG TPA: 50S ribosomal protein L25/general stress protein Ctc [Gammaproteobacteria bacterium]|nr:50S ribosomal protein L25/general stress protein Ctc [Gammaproteobacteria bacterium]
MSTSFVLNAEVRTDLGKGASRRLRRTGKVPAVMYGAHKDPVSLTLDHDQLFHNLENEAFYSHILTIKLPDGEEQAILKDLQRHPAKPVVLHVDLQRVSAKEAIRVHVPLHFINGDISPGVKAGGLVTHNMTETEVSCLPGDLPEYIEVDLAKMELNDTLHLSDLELPNGVELVALALGAEHDQPVAAIHLPRGAKDAEGEEGEGEEEAAAEGEEGGE